MNGKNVAKGKRTIFLGSNHKSYLNSDLNRITNDHYNSHTDNFNHYWHGDKGRYYIHLDLGK